MIKNVFKERKLSYVLPCWVLFNYFKWYIYILLIKLLIKEIVQTFNSWLSLFSFVELPISDLHFLIDLSEVLSASYLEKKKFRQILSVPSLTMTTTLKLVLFSLYLSLSSNLTAASYFLFLLIKISLCTITIKERREGGGDHCKNLATSLMHMVFVCMRNVL